MYRTTHGDALTILRSRGATDDEKLYALDVIISNEYKTDSVKIPQPIMWDLLKMLYRKYKESQ